jgi:ribosome-associated protein
MATFKEFQLSAEFIELDNLLKVMRIVASGAEAKHKILAGSVKVNGQVEMRVRRKLHRGDYLELGELRVEIA